MSLNIINPFKFTAPEETYCQAPSECTAESAIRYLAGQDPDYTRLGIKVTASDSNFIQDDVTKVSIFARRYGTPSGNIYCKVYAANGTTVIATSDAVLIQNVSTSAAYVDFNFSSSFDIAQNYYIVCDVIDATMSYGNWWTTCIGASSEYSDTSTVKFNNDPNGGWETMASSWDVKLCITYSG